MGTGTMIPTTPHDEAARRRLIEFASDAAQLADTRPDPELRDLVDGLFGDLIELRPDDDERRRRRHRR